MSFVLQPLEIVMNKNHDNSGREFAANAQGPNSQLSDSSNPPLNYLVAEVVNSGPACIEV